MRAVCYTTLYAFDYPRIRKPGAKVAAVGLPKCGLLD
jgi:hypothetical protein